MYAEYFDSLSSNIFLWSPDIVNRYYRHHEPSQPSDSQPSDSQPPDSQPSDSQPPDSQPPDSQPPDSQPPDSQPYTDAAAVSIHRF